MSRPSWWRNRRKDDDVSLFSSYRPLGSGGAARALLERDDGGDCYNMCFIKLDMSMCLCVHRQTRVKSS
jgi:hypothetical protein